MQTDELAEQLNALQRDECYRVDEVLKRSSAEVTQRVFFVGANGSEQGPYVRKYIERGCGMGAAYERIFEAQREGRRFRYIPHIIDCYHAGEKLVVVMEFVQGETLADYVYRRDPSLELAKRVFPQICDAVAELHEEFDPPIIHRDLKPGNIMVSDAGLSVIDFGIARQYRDDADVDTARFGTRAYAPPEQFGYAQTSVRSDVYALGMILYYCLAEKTPDPRLTETGFAEDCIPQELRHVLVKATAFDPEARYASARELRAAFEAAAAEAKARAGNPRGGYGVSAPVPYDAFDAATAYGLPGAAAERGADSADEFASDRADSSAHEIASAHGPTRAGRSAHGLGQTFSYGTASEQARVSTNADTPSASARFEKMSQPKESRLQRVPLWVGVAWDIVLVAVWAVLFAASCVSSFMPNEKDATLPLWFRLLEYHGFISVPAAATFYLLLDKRLLRKKFPALARRTWRRDAVAAFAVIGVAIALVIFAAQFVVSNGVFA